MDLGFTASMNRFFNYGKSERSVYHGPYKGTFKGIGMGAVDIRNKYAGHVLGAAAVYDYLNWMQNNQAEVEKMKAEAYNYLLELSGKGKEIYIQS